MFNYTCKCWIIKQLLKISCMMRNTDMKSIVTELIVNFFHTNFLFLFVKSENYHIAHITISA